MATLPATIGRSAFAPTAHTQTEGFDFSDFRTFTEIPRHNHDVVAMHGLVIVFDKLAPHHEGFVEGKLYVRENQHAPASGAFEDWLRRELHDGDASYRAQPYAPLVTRREVVQYIRHPHTGGPSFRLDSRYIDGPFKEHCFGFNVIGKVVGIHAPAWEAAQ